MSWAQELDLFICVDGEIWGQPTVYVRGIHVGVDVMVNRFEPKNQKSCDD